MENLLLNRLERYHQLSQEAFEKGDYKEAEYYADKFDELETKLLAVINNK